MVLSIADPCLNAALTCVDSFYARLFRDWPTAVNQVHDGYTLSYSGDNRLTGANHLWVEDASVLRLDVLSKGQRFFDAFGAAWSVITTDTHLPDALDFLDQQHFTVRWCSPLMALQSEPEPLPVRLDARVIRACTSRHLLDVQQIMTEAFATRRSVNERITRIAHLDDPDIDHYLVYVGTEAVACGTVVQAGDMAGVWNVGTRRAWRRQGYATTLMRALLADQAARGRTTSMLMASAAGRPIYERLGYREIGITTYSGPPFGPVLG